MRFRLGDRALDRPARYFVERNTLKVNFKKTNALRQSLGSESID
jgi:hypothetical protein